ncbi:MAG: hypothetical protein JW869_05190 [Candidatus Omnitrophica bacterium]|nr:hypothetical protein [Candidatus Omnitrophota bacterium]
MKTLLIILVLIITLVIVFVDSKTWQIELVERKRGDDTFIEQEHSLHWDRFIDYLKAMPKNLLNKLKL